MPNQLSFDVQFSRKQMEEILKEPEVMDITVSGTYTYNPDLGQNVWEMKAFGQGTNSNKSNVGLPVPACIKPCS